MNAYLELTEWLAGKIEIRGGQTIRVVLLVNRRNQPTDIDIRLFSANSERTGIGIRIPFKGISRILKILQKAERRSKALSKGLDKES